MFSASESSDFKAALGSFGEEFQTLNLNIYNVKDRIIQTQGIYLFHIPINKLSEENKVTGTLFDASKVAGSATHKQSKTV